MPSSLLDHPKAHYLKALKTQKGCIGILGTGISGRAVAALCEKLGLSYSFFDEKTGSRLSRQDVDKQDLFVYSPGFRQDHPWLEWIRQGAKPCLGEWNLGASLWQGPFISITGTNGKTTLTELLARAFQLAKVPALALGNNSYPLCQALADGASPETLAVCELSSFQAENTAFLQSDALVWTNISEDHLDRYETLEAYFKAKWNLTQTLKPTAPFFTEADILQKANTYGLDLPPTVQLVDKIEKDALTLPSAFSLGGQKSNYHLARAFWKTTGLDIAFFDQAAEAFQPLKHRLQKIATVQGGAYWNDSKGTNFSATLMALKSFEKPVYWIGGGQSKGGDLEGFCTSIVPYIEKAFLIGETAPQLKAMLEAQGRLAILFSSLEGLLLELLKGHPPPPGQNVVLSPGFSSLDQFKNYAERGDVFERMVLGFAKS